MTTLSWVPYLLRMSLTDDVSWGLVSHHHPELLMVG